MAVDNQDSLERGLRPTMVFVMEQTLGHVTHTKNLQALVPRHGRLAPEFVLVPYEPGRWSVPPWSNWTVRAGLRANRAMWSELRQHGRPAAMFVHTQVSAVLLGPWMRSIPTVVSIDATPMQYDQLGDFYAHERSHPKIEAMKSRANRACFARAQHIVSWSNWGKRGLVDEYGVPPAKVTVIPPGVDVDRWARPPTPVATESDGPVRILFVGGDLRRKGGDLLLDAVRVLREDPELPSVELHLATGSDIADQPGVIVHRGLTANSQELIDLYHASDVFCLPTLGDCLPMVLAEAAAAGLPLVSTDVGAIGEIVRPESTGALVPTGDREALTAALRRLVSDPTLRRRYGRAARELAEAEHDAKANAARIVTILEQVATQQVVS